MRTWVFADFSLPSIKRIEMFGEIGITDVVLGISSDRHKFKLNSSERRIEDTCWKIDDRGMKVHLMTWAIRNQRFIEESIVSIRSIADKCPVYSYLLNAEGTWHRGRALTPERAAELVREGMGEGLVGVVGFDKLHRSVRPLAEVCDYIIPEAYSFWNKKPGHWSQSPSTFPGVQQRKAFDSWKVVDAPMVMGLACYMGARPKSGKFPGFTDIQSMRYSIAESMAIIRENQDKRDFWGVGAYWSGKHLDGNSKLKRDRREFIKNLSEMPTMMFP